MSGKSRKRRIEEETTRVKTEETEFRPKKLRIPPKEPVWIQSLEDAVKSGNEADILASLAEYQEKVEKTAIKDPKRACDCLLTLLRNNSQEYKVVRAVGVIIRSILDSKHGWISGETDALFQDLAAFLKVDSSPLIPLVLSIVRDGLLKGLINTERPLFSEIYRHVLLLLSHPGFLVRQRCLHLLGACLKHIAEDSRTELEEHVSQSMKDRDPRVRSQAVHCLLEISQEWNLGIKVYAAITSLLAESCDAVRVGCLRLIKHFAITYAEEVVDGTIEGVRLRLVDDAFTYICHAMQDPSVRVRTEAAQLLGDLVGVSSSFLQQTLDKKLLSRMKVTKNKLRRDFLQEWATGRRFGADAPAELNDEESRALIPTGACGAFVVGLEDEYMAVRRACIKSLGTLARDRPTFAAAALDSLTDMFNDEIEEVSLDAIVALQPMIHYSQLDQGQMETILNVLNDVMPDSRNGMRELLQSSRLTSIATLKMCINALMDNLRRYPCDNDSILQCLQSLGFNHAAMVQSMVDDLLELHPWFHIPEPNIQNQQYIAKLILVLNSAAKCPAIQAVFPGHVWRHYHYLRHSCPNLVPQLDIHQCGTESGGKDVAVEEITEPFRNKVYHWKKSAGNKERRQLLCLFMKDARAMSRSEMVPSGSADYVHDMCGLLLLLNDALAAPEAFNGASLEKMLKKLMEVRSLYSGCEESKLLQIKTKALALAIRFAGKKSGQSLESLCECRKECEKLDSEASVWMSKVEEACEGEMENLLELLNEWEIEPPSLDSALGVRKKGTRIIEPSQYSEAVIRFTAGLATSAPFVAVLENFQPEDLPNVRILVKYPDKETAFHRPRLSDFRTISDSEIRLRTEIVLSANAWNDPAPVHLELVLLPTKSKADAVKIPWKREFSSRDKSDESVTVSLFPKMRV